MDTPTIKKKGGRPSSGIKTRKYTIALPVSVEPAAEWVKNNVGLSKAIAECIEKRYAERPQPPIHEHD